ncbi:MAG: hypothetical protein PUI45_04585 [Spirochaetales bacterium]|nr:hypothetical protein [Spirochaetales bacterium]
MSRRLDEKAFERLVGRMLVRDDGIEVVWDEDSIIIVIIIPSEISEMDISSIPVNGRTIRQPRHHISVGFKHNIPRAVAKITICIIKKHTHLLFSNILQVSEGAQSMKQVPCL